MQINYCTALSSFLTFLHDKSKQIKMRHKNERAYGINGVWHMEKWIWIEYRRE